MAAAVRDLIVSLSLSPQCSSREVGRLIGITMQEATEQLAAARGILEDLYAQLDWALNLWSRTTANGDEQGLPPQPQHDHLIPSQPVIEEPPSHVPRRNSPPADIKDPKVASQMRHTKQWEEWTQAPTIHDPSILDLSRPTRWWMQEQTQYGLCQPGEQDQLEHSARAAQFNRIHVPVPASTSIPSRSFTREVRIAQPGRFHPSALLLSPVPGVQLSYGRTARADSDNLA